MLNFMKRLTSPRKYNEASIRVLEGGGQHGEKYPEFDNRLGVRSYQSWVYAAASINAQACAATPLRLYVKRKRGRKALVRTREVPRTRKSYLMGDHGGNLHSSARTITKLMELGDDFEEVTDSHPITDLLTKVNPRMNGFDLTVSRILYGELTGNSYLCVVNDPTLGVPVQLWTMPSQWCYIIPDQQKFIKGYSYGTPGQPLLEFGVDEVIHFRRPNPNDLFYGMGKVEAAWGTIGINKAMHEMDLSMYANHARPDYAVVVKGPTGTNNLDRFEDYVNERLQGTRKAGRFLTMTGDVQLTPLNFPPKDLSGREEVVEEIAAVFGVPVTLMKANDPNLASAKTGYSQWREGTVLPLLRMDEDELNQSLIPKFGLEGDAVLAYDNPVPRDENFELQKRASGIQSGWMTINEARMEEGHEPFDLPEADAPLINGQPVMAQPEQPPAGPEGPPEASPPDNEAQTPEDPEASEEKVVEPLNGAQVDSIVRLLDGVAAGTVSPSAGVEVLVATGIDRAAAENMLTVQQQAKPQAEAEAELAEEVAAKAVSRFLRTKADDCGTGSGGFKPGNDCAGSGGGGSSDQGGQALADADRSEGSAESSKTADKIQKDANEAMGPIGEDEQAEIQRVNTNTKEFAGLIDESLDGLTDEGKGAVFHNTVEMCQALADESTEASLNAALAERGVISPDQMEAKYGSGRYAALDFTKDGGPLNSTPTIPMSSMDPNQLESAKMMLAAANIAHEKYLPADARVAVTFADSASFEDIETGMGTANAVASSGFKISQIQFNIDDTGGFEPTMPRFNAIPGPVAIYVHEFGHVAHNQVLKSMTDRKKQDAAVAALQDFGKNLDDFKTAAKISGYSASNGMEFVAESYVVKRMTPEVWSKMDPDVHKLYETMGGP